MDRTNGERGLPNTAAQAPGSVYIIRAGDRTYAGFTTDFAHRLRQHNGELTGGARSTGCARGRWELVVLLTGFPSARAARQLEWRMHRRWPTAPSDGGCRVRARLRQLGCALRMERWTRTAPLCAEVVLNMDAHWGRARAELFPEPEPEPEPAEHHRQPRE